ncbi:MAG TPA: GH25 family lysozyme [Polyangia bacterium]|jgi:lysozyme
MTARAVAVALAALAAGCGGRAGAGFGAAESALGVCAAGDVVQGIDVSHYDGTIDWAMVKASGVDFAFMKATEGTTFVDPEFATNWKAAGDAGVIRGGYHFFHPMDDPAAQADFFVATAGVPATGDLPLALDLETTDSVSNAEVASATAAFLARVQADTGRVPVVYTSERFWTSFSGPATGFDQYALWDAQWTTACPNMPSAWPGWTFWQYSATGTVPGVSGMANVDLDQFNGSLAALQGWVDGTSLGDGGVDGGSDGGAPLDAGSVDAGATNPHHRGCSFAAGASSSSGAWILAALGLMAWNRTRRRDRFVFLTARR